MSELTTNPEMALGKSQTADLTPALCASTLRARDGAEVPSTFPTKDAEGTPALNPGRARGESPSYIGARL